MQLLVIITYVILSLFQLATISAALDGWIGLHGMTAVFVAYFIAFTPLVGNVVGMLAAVSLWEWSWLQAAELFFGPYAVILILTIAVGVFGRFWKGFTTRAVTG